MKNFSISEALQAGWQRAIDNIGVFIGLMLLPAVGYFLILISPIMATIGDDTIGALLAVSLNLLAMLVMLFAAVALLQAAICAARDGNVSFKDAWPTWGVVLRFLGAGIVLSIAVVVVLFTAGAVLGVLGISSGAAGVWGGEHVRDLGLVLLLVILLVGFMFMAGSIYVSIRLNFFQYAIVADRAGILSSFAKSWKATRGVFWNLLGFSIIVSIINFIGALLFGLGLLITMPMTTVATAYVYKVLSGNAGTTSTGDQSSHTEEVVSGEQGPSDSPSYNAPNYPAQ